MIFHSVDISISCIIINFILLPLMLSEGDEENSAFTHLPLYLQIIKRAGTERGTSSIIESGQKYTEASI